MKKLLLLVAIAALTLHASAQISDVQFRIGADYWKLNYTASPTQVNCGLCPQLIQQQPGTKDVIDGLQDSLMTENYFKGGLNIAISAAILTPALRGEVQIGPSMRKLTPEGDEVGSRYANQNVSVFFGFNPMQLDEFAGKFYLGSEQKTFLDLSDAGVYVQASYDTGFEEYVRSTNNLAVLARWQPTVWLSDEQRVGVALKAGARMWLLGNGKAEGPFVNANGIPKKVKPASDWFIGIGLKVAPF